MVSDAVRARRARARKRSRLSLRYKVLARDGYRCVDCGVSAQKLSDLFKREEVSPKQVLCFELQLHHIIPQCKGGTDSLKNCVSLCHWCHARRHNIPPMSVKRGARASLCYNCYCMTKTERSGHCPMCGGVKFRLNV